MIQSYPDYELPLWINRNDFRKIKHDIQIPADPEVLIKIISHIERQSTRELAILIILNQHNYAISNGYGSLRK